MKKRAFTLVEIVLTVFFIGIITVSIFPLLFSEMNRLNAAFSFTESGFDAQTKLEGEINNLVSIEAENINPSDTTSEKKEKEEKLKKLSNWSDGGSELSIDLFGVKNIPVLSKTIKTDKKNLGTGKDYVQDVLVILPKSKGYKVNRPEIKVQISKSANNKYRGSVSYIKNSMTGDSWENQIDFCVYRWYIGEYSGKKPDITKLTLIREYNIAKNLGKPRIFEKATQFKYKLKGEIEKLGITDGTEGFNLIADGPYVYFEGTPPLVVDGVSKTQGDNIDLVRLNGGTSSTHDLTDRERTALYGRKGLVFSAMPVTKAGTTGKEVFSEMLDLKIPEERLQLGVSPNLQKVVGTNSYKVKFLIKQVDNNEHGHTYSFRVKDLSDDTTYYPFRDDALGYYVLKKDPKTFTASIETDMGGNGVFEVLLKQDGHFEISILDGNNIVMQANLKSKPGFLH